MCDPIVQFQKYNDFPSVLNQVFGILYAEAGAVRASDVVCSICAKRQTKGLSAYLKDVGASAFVVERQYVDRDFMEDYASYYARCFQQLGRFCCRVHFWGPGVDIDEMTNKLHSTIDGHGIEGISLKLCEQYLGYVVFRPLPHTVYGRICLRPYASERNVCFCACQKITAHLLGVPLYVETMPFQEQDSIISACATSALWSAFQITGRKFIHAIPSPNRITNMATNGGDCETRPFPNKGLTIGQMGRAIFMVGLSQQTISSRTRSVFLAEVYAYLKIGLPVVLVVEIVDAESTGGYSADWHAITVCGYHIKANGHGRVCKDIRLLGADIDALYCHDDRIAPFSKMTVCDNGDEGANTWNSQIQSQHADGYEILSIKYAFVPVYHKIRIGLIDIIDSLHEFNDFLNKALMAGVRGCGAVDDELIWNIHLTTDREVKQNVRTVGNCDSKALEAVLNCAMPRYIWQVSVSLGKDRLAVFLIDATGIAQGLNVFMVQIEDVGFGKLLATVAMESALSNNAFAMSFRQTGSI